MTELEAFEAFCLEMKSKNNKSIKEIIDELETINEFYRAHYDSITYLERVKLKQLSLELQFKLRSIL